MSQPLYPKNLLSRLACSPPGPNCHTRLFLWHDENALDSSLMLWNRSPRSAGGRILRW